MVLGVSLGGHAAWHCLLHDPRITTAIVVIGCPDYVRLMSDRARLSKRKTWIETEPPGSKFLGSPDFPPGLVDAVQAWDPVGLVSTELGSTTGSDDLQIPSQEEQERLAPVMRRCLQGKRILNLAGGADRLVPYKCAEPFLKWLKMSIGEDGWFRDGEVVLEDIVFDGVGHEMSEGMMKEVLRFLNDRPAPVKTATSEPVSASKGSKI